MNKTVGLVVFVVGIVLLIFGFNAADSFSSGFSEFFTGSPSKKAIGLLVAGAVMTAVGAVGFFKNQK